MMIKPLNVLGLIGGTSLDGIKASLISTDGVDIYETKAAKLFLFPDPLRQKIRSIIGKKNDNPADRRLIEETDAETTAFIIDIIQNFLDESGEEIDLAGLEGPTVCHLPREGYTYQLGKGRLIAGTTGLKIVTHFRNADILNGGQGAPITASYYNALAAHLEKPAAFIKIGGITTITQIGQYGEITAFDCGPGNALINDWMLKHAGILMDYGGKYAALGKPDEKIISNMMNHGFFAQYPPKTADRNAFNDKTEHLEGLSAEDGAATATAFVAEAAAYSLALYLPELPQTAIICGGGAENPTLIRYMRQRLKDMDIQAMLGSEAGLQIDDASAIAFLAARRFYRLPITFPTTTGIAQPMTGGEIYEKGEEK